MAKETNFKHPPKGHVGLLAYDSVNDRWQVVHVDEDGQLHIEIKAELPAGTKNIGDVDVATMPTVTVIPGSGEKLIGFSGIVEERLRDIDLSVNTNVLTGTTVPTGEVWVLTHVSIQYDGSVPTRMYVEATGLATATILFWKEEPTPAVFYVNTFNVLMQAGDYIRAIALGSTLHDGMNCMYSGYKMTAP